MEGFSFPHSNFRLANDRTQTILPVDVYTFYICIVLYVSLNLTKQQYTDQAHARHTIREKKHNAIDGHIVCLAISQLTGF